MSFGFFFLGKETHTDQKKRKKKKEQVDFFFPIVSMYESRLRAAWLQNQKGQSGTDNRFAATSSIYRNRAHSLILQNNKDNGAVVAKRKHNEYVQNLQSKRMKLETQLKSKHFETEFDFIDDLLAEREAVSNLKAIDSQLKKLSAQCPEQLWHERVQTLKAEYVASLAVLNYASGNLEELFAIDADRCNCGRIFHFETITHENVCTACNVCCRVLIAAEDIQTDVLLLKNKQNPTSAFLQRLQRISDPNPPQSPANPDLLLLQTQQPDVILRPAIPLIESSFPLPLATAIASKTHIANKLGNITTYRKYVMQFAPDACPIPKHVWKLLYESFASIHLLSSLRCKPVPVTKILKDNNLQMYISHSARITKLFNGEPVPVLSHQLIENLLRRWKELRDVAALSTDIKGLPAGIEMLTHVFLLAEGRPDLASAFTTHKTNNVSATQTQKFCQLIEKCARTSKLSWRIESWNLQT